MSKKILSFYDYLTGITCNRVDFRNKDALARLFVKKKLIECQSMIEFDGLPDTMPERDIKRLLQCGGFMAVLDPAKTGGRLYAFSAGLGGEPGPYYMPTIATISNPALDLSVTATIDEDVIIVPHDSFYMGLLPILEYYGSMIAETDLSLFIASILTRAPVHISAQGDRAKASADQYLADLEKGKLGTIFEDGFLDGIKGVPASQGSANNSITNLIELRQYYKASCYNEIGLNSNYNMKRESINSVEAQMDNDALLPYVEDVIRTINKGLDKIRAKGWADIHVRLGDAWAIRKEKELELPGEEEPQDEEDENEETEPA